MVSQAFKQTRFTPGCTSFLFTGDVFDMKGGKYENHDLRLFFQPYLNVPEAELLLTNKPKDEKFGRFQTLTLVSRTKEQPVTLYNPVGLIEDGHPLTLQQGHKTVSSFRDTNRLWNGKFVIEYDLVDCDKRGKKYLFMDGASLLEATSVRKDNEDDLDDALGTDDEEFVSFVKRKIDPEVLNADKGPIVSGSTLLTEIKILAELFKEETESEEKTRGLDPVMRKLLLPEGFPKDKPMFDVAFLTNVMLMGFKAVFYPTVLEELSSFTKGVDVIKLNALLAAQTELLLNAMPRIVASVSRTLSDKKCVKFFKIDVGGTKNLSLPANVKPDELAMPYHQFKVHENGVVEISNKELVTSLGVKKRPFVNEWLNELGVFERKYQYAISIGRGGDKLDNNEWRRKLLFSRLADTLPFRYRTEFIDLDYYVSGLCFSFLSSEYGMSIDYDPEFVTSVINHTGGPMTMDESGKVNAVGYSSSGVAMEGNSSTVETTASLASNDIARSNAPPNPLPLSSDASRRIYESLLASDSFYTVLPLLQNSSDELGMIIVESSEEYASLIINLLTSKTKKERKYIVENVFKRKIPLLWSVIDQKIVDTSGESEYYMAVAYSILQMVVRHIIRDRGIVFGSPEFNQTLSNMKWVKLDLDHLWRCLYMESINKPSSEMDEATAAKYAKIGQEDSTSVKDGDRLMEIISEINDKEETEEIIALKNKTVEMIGDGHDCYPFASSAYEHDTMFLWTVVTLAERFCQLYNAVNNPEEYYRAMVSEENKLSFEGGQENFIKLCSRLKSELQIFLCCSDREHTFVCRQCVEKSEREFETNKNRVNKELFLIKKKELEMTTPSTTSVPIPREKMTSEEVYRYKADTEKLCRNIFDEILEVEAEADREEEEEECSSDYENYESCDEDNAFLDEEHRFDKDAVMKVERNVVPERLKEDVINGFFNRYAEVKSFRGRSALCHRQKYISINSLLVMDKLLSGYVVTPKIVKYQDVHARILEEVRRRSKRGKGWVIPYTFPVDRLRESSCCKGEVKLLVVPDSSSLRQLTTALRFNTMACERRFFTDVSTSLGFVPQADVHPQSILSSPSFFFNTDSSKYCDFYENIIKVEEDLRLCLLPRFKARYAAETYESSLKNLEEHASFFAGLWAICAKANLENTVLSAVVSCPQTASYTLKGNNTVNNDSIAKHVARAVEAIGKRKQISLVKTFLEFAGCVDLVSMDRRTTLEADKNFFLKLHSTYNRANDCNGTHLWTLFSVMKRCFNNSLPLDWHKLLENNSHLNLVPNAPNTDESGALFETARFISRCSELILGKTRKRLKECITREEWQDLLTGNGWSSRIALVYEKVMNTNDSRTTENFINSSTFLSNNNVSKKISLSETKNEKIRQSCWSIDESSLSVDERIDLLMAVERTNRDMTFSTVMICCALYSLFVEGCRVEDITNKDSKNFDRFIPFLKSLSIVTATWNSSGGGELNTSLEYNFDNLIEVCAKNGRFVDIENDPVFFYRFAAYTLGMLANNDQFFEDLTSIITESFDFNGFDTRNWNDFVEKHFLSVLLGRRAFLESRPAAFIKRMVGSSNDEKSSSDSVRRLAKLMMVKAVDANDVTLSDLVLCCIEDDKEDFIVRSAKEYQNKFYRLGKKTVKETNATDSTMSSNSCSNEQMSKKVKASRPLDVRVYFNKKSDIKAIEKNEEEEADLSYGLYTDTVEKAVIKPERGGTGGDGAGSSSGGGGGDDQSLAGERKRLSRQRENNTKNFNGRTEDLYDHSSREDTSGTMSSFVAATNSTGGSAFMREKDIKFRKDAGFTEDDLIKANDNIVKRARKLMRQDEIKENICQMIDSISEGLRIVCPFNSHDDPSLLGLSRTVANRVIETVRAWNAIVAREVALFKEECKEIEKSSTYDMKLVLCSDYTSEGINSGFGDELHVFKTPLFDVISAEGKRVEIEKTNRRKKKNYNNDDDGLSIVDRNSHEPHKDTIRTVSGDMFGDTDAFKKYDDAYCQRYIGFGDGPKGNGILFKQRLQEDRILDPSLVAHFFSSNLIDPYLRSVVPRLMQHNIGHEGKVSVNASGKKRMGSEGASGRKKGGDDRVNLYAFSSLNIIRTYSDLSRLKQCANEKNSNLVSLYDNVTQEQQVNGVSDIITKEDVKIPIRRGGVNGEEDYASVNALWLCNSGIHPRDQIEMFKKMVFRNYNKLWLKIYSEAINVFRKWGVLTKATIDRPFFSVKFTTMPAQVVDNNPPNSVLHSKFLPIDNLAERVSATNPMIRLREYYSRSVGMTSMETFRPLNNIDAEVLDRAILSREFMTSTYDNRGSFVTSKFTNAATFVFTPGTSTEGRDYRTRGYTKDEDFAGKEEMLCVNSFNMCYGNIVSSLKYGVFEDTTSKSLEGGRNRVLRLYDNDTMLSSKSGSINVVGVPSEASKIKCDSVMKKAAKDTIKDTNHTTRVKHSVYGHLTAQYSAINDNYNARNILMSIRRVNRAAGENSATNDDNKIIHDEEKNKGADDLSLRYILGRHRGYVFYADDFPSEQKHSTHLSLLKKCFSAIRDRNVNEFSIFPKEWLALSIVPEITRNARMASKIKFCIRIDRRIDVGADINFSDLAPKKNKRDDSMNLRKSINRSDASVGFEKRGVSFLADPVVSMRWFLMRGHHLRLSCTDFGVALLSNFMGNRENKSTPMDVPPSAKSLATVFKMKATRNSCVSMDNNRFFLIGGSYVLGGRLEGVNLVTDMFVRCKLQTEKHIVHEALFDANVTTAFLATCMEGTAITRGVSMIEHISRLTNATMGDSKSKNFWSLSTPHNGNKERTQSEYCYARDASLAIRPPSVCIDDDNYVFLRMLFSVVAEMDKKRDTASSKVDRHVAAAIKKSYAEVLNPKNGLPNMHSLFHLRSIMNFCGFVNGICTGDGEKAHHLMHTLSAVGINMTPKTVLAFIGVDGNNLKSSLVNIVKARWWDMYTDLSADALVGKGDSSSTDAKLAYVAGKKNIFIMEEVGYQGSIKEKKGRQGGVSGGGGGYVDAADDKMSSLDSINTRNIEVASNLWDRVYKRLKDNNMRVCELETTTDGSLMALGRKRLRDEDDEEEENEEEAMVVEFDKDKEAVPSSKKKMNIKKNNNKTLIINMFSNKVSWWSHIKGPVVCEIDRDKAISCLISNSEVPFCTLSENIIDNSPWVRETDSILVNHRYIESKLAPYTPILTPPGAVGMRDEEDVEEDIDDLDLLSASASASSSPCPLSLNASKIKEDCLNLIRKEPSNNSFRTFSKMKELLMSIGYNENNEWFIDENRHVLTPRRTSAGEAATNTAKAVTCPAIFAMHAFSPSNYSRGIFKGFRRNYLHVPGKDVTKRIGSYLSKPRRAAKAMYSDFQLKQTVEQTIAHIIHFPSKYSFPAMTVDGSELFPIKPEASSRIVDMFIRLNKTNLRGGRISKEIAAISELASSISNNEQQKFSSVFLSPDSFDKGVHETNRTDVNFLDLMRNTRSANNNKLNVIERTFAAALENCDNSKTGSNVVQESNLASSKVNRGSPFTEEMLPGQVSSNLIKQIASTDSIMSVRGLHGRPITCSVSATPVMISNSFLLRYYVDTAMYKRMLIFPFDTNFAPRNVEPNVELGDKIIRSGLKVIHASLLCERSDMWSINENKKYVSVLKERLDEWNGLTGCCYDLSQVNSLVSMFPSVFLKHVMKTKVLELSDNSNLIKLEEACNTFFQSHTSIMLSSRPNMLIKSKNREKETFDDDEQAPSHKQICTINSKTMDTLQACIDRAKSGGVWGLVNSALRSVIFINAPFVDTKVLYGEGCTVKMMLDEEISPTINMSSGLRLPDLDGIGRNGTVGVGDALMKQLVGSWGTANIKNSMYSCHHLHTMFELVLQETTVQKKLKNVGDLASDYMSNVAFLLISSVYIEMFERFGVFANNGGSGAKRTRIDASTEEDAVDGSSSYPVFMSMIVNKSIGHLNSLTNLADVEEKIADNGCHAKKITQVLSMLGKRLSTAYLCPSCKGKT